MLEMEALQYKGFRNIIENGEAVGFQVCIRFVAYRGPWFGQFRFGNIIVDGEEFGRDVCTFTLGGVEYTFDEMMDNPFLKWQLNDVCTVRVRKAGGLSQGSHTVTANFSEIASYLPPRLDAFAGYARPGDTAFTRELIIV